MEGLARHGQLAEGLLLAGIGVVAFGIRLFSVIRFESIIHEFDPWFNYRATRYLVDHGWDDFINWFDDKAWYPLGRVVGGTLYPGIMLTSAAIHALLNRVLHAPVDIRNICVLLAPFFSGFTALATYALTRELKDGPAGLLAAAFVAISPGYISRSVAGSYDNEAISIFLMMATFWLWVRAVKRGSAAYGVLAALSYYYMVGSWGGYVFIINLIPLHVLALLAMGRYTHGIYAAYSSFYVIGTLSAMTVKWVNFQPVSTSEHMAAMGVFGLLQVFAFVHALKPYAGDDWKVLSRAIIALVGVLGALGFAGMSLMGKVAPWAGRFYAMWDTEYAKAHMPIIASVSEHQPTTWASLFLDLHALLFLFPAGLFFCFRQRRNEHVFAIVFAVTASYFAGVMVRLILTLTPIVCVCSGLAVSSLLDTFVPAVKPLSESDLLVRGAATPSSSPSGPKPSTAASSPSPKTIASKDSTISWDMRLLVLAPLLYLLGQYVQHCTFVASTQYSSPSVIMATTMPNGQARIIDDFREAYQWIRKNTPPEAKVLAWWDYGYQLAGMADRPTIVDNNTWNNEHIALVGRILASNEADAYPLLRQLDVDYILVLCGAVSGFSGDDMNKFLWMIRIAEGVFPAQVREADFYNAQGEFRVDLGGTKTLHSSLLYKMSYAGLQEVLGPRGMDRVRQQSLAGVDPKLESLTEVYTSENFIIRLYQVRKPDALGRPLITSK